MRRSMIKRGVCKKNVARVNAAIKKFQLYFDFYPKASEESFKKYCKKNWEHLMVLMPGKTAPTYNSFQEQLTNLI